MLNTCLTHVKHIFNHTHVLHIYFTSVSIICLTYENALVKHVYFNTFNMCLTFVDVCPVYS